MHCLAVFSGLGSLLSGYLKQSKQRIARFALLSIIVLTIIYLLVFPTIFQTFLASSLALRIIITVLLLAPLGLFMGMPFPIGLGTLAGDTKRFAPWAWGINGATSVLGSVLAIILAMALGFKIVSIIAAAGYFAAILLFPKK